MRCVEHEVFLPEELREFACTDTPLPIESGQTITQPCGVQGRGDGAGNRLLLVKVHSTGTCTASLAAAEAAFLGMVTVSCPSLAAALRAVASAFSGREKLRVKLP